MISRLRVCGKQLRILKWHIVWQNGVVKGLKDISLSLGKDKLAYAREKTIELTLKKTHSLALEKDII